MDKNCRKQYLPINLNTQIHWNIVGNSDKQNCG